MKMKDEEIYQVQMEDDEFIELAKSNKIKGYMVFKCCKVTYNKEKDEFIKDETKNIFVKFLWWLIETFPIWDGKIVIEEENE